jgi:restriction system protein
MKYFVDDIIDGRSVTLKEFISILLSSNIPKIFPNNCFPTNEMFDEYIETIQIRSDDEIKEIIKRFIVQEGTYGTDGVRLQTISQNNEWLDKIRENYPLHFNRLLGKKNVWEGITWIIDLLPRHPQNAINVIDAFFAVYCQILPDNVLVGLSQVNEIIRAKYYFANHPLDVLHNLTPIEFESLIAELYNDMGYEIQLTKKSYDGGIDVIAVNKTIGKNEEVLIQCKRYSNNVGVKDIRELLGVVENYKATKGVFCTSSSYSSSAFKFAKNSNRLELLDGRNIINLCNEYFGSNWPNKIGVYMYKYGKY